jgi:hypothetical protein
MSSFAKSAEPPFAAEAGTRAPPRDADPDPYRTLDDLMAAVEALCPQWPERSAGPTRGTMLL